MSVDAPTTIPADVATAAAAGRRLDAAQVRALAGLTDILALGALADDVRRARHGAATSYVRVHDLDLAQVETWAAPPTAAREVRLTGTPASTDEAVEAVLRAKGLAGTCVLRGFDLGALQTLGGEALLRELALAGLDEVATVEPGPGAADAVAAARGAGLVVRVIGLGAPVADRAAWLLDVRALVDAVGGIDAVAPLPRTADVTTPTTGFDDVRSVSLARLALETVASIQVDWQRHGPKLAQVALTVGADDLDNVAAADDASLGVRRAPLADALRNITAAALTPAERDGRFGRLAG